MKIVTIVGARPQFVKAAVFSRRVVALAGEKNSPEISEVVIHTGQHFDKQMSEVFFDELNIPKPRYNLGIGNLSHGAMTGRMIEGIENVLREEKPQVVVLYGDTNSTLAGAIAASKLSVPVAHIEAGLRSRSETMPEEINRKVADLLSHSLYCPTSLAVENLKEEGIKKRVYNVGDVMYDAALEFGRIADEKVDLDFWGVAKDSYVLCTLHRAENTDSVERLSSILEALRSIATELPVIIPLHPRTRKRIASLESSSWMQGLNVIKPVSYLEMVGLEQSASAIITDSGGVQKEAFFHRVPCITVRDETEWKETVELGWNRVVGADQGRIEEAWRTIGPGKEIELSPYGDGKAGEKILKLVEELYG